MRSADAPASPTAFLGVRLTPEELERLDRFQRSQECPTRSDAVRALVRAADRLSEVPLEVPPALEHIIEEIAIDGYAGSRDAALAVVLNLGIAALTQTHDSGVPALRRAAKERGERAASRRAADREGRERLER